jgi:hypothetical protein
MIAIGVLSAADSQALPSGILMLGQEQKTAYELVKADGVPVSQFASKNESAQSDEVQVAVRELVEDDKVLALVGATSNEATMRAASLVNFFNLPMIIPTAGGDNSAAFQQFVGVPIECTRLGLRNICDRYAANRTD